MGGSKKLHRCGGVCLTSHFFLPFSVKLPEGVAYTWPSFAHFPFTPRASAYIPATSLTATSVWPPVAYMLSNSMDPIKFFSHLLPYLGSTLLIQTPSGNSLLSWLPQHCSLLWSFLAPYLSDHVFLIFLSSLFLCSPPLKRWCSPNSTLGLVFFFHTISLDELINSKGLHYCLPANDTHIISLTLSSPLSFRLRHPAAFWTYPPGSSTNTSNSMCPKLKPLFSSQIRCFSSFSYILNISSWLS